MMEPIPIILLKTKSNPADPYYDYFSTHPFDYLNGTVLPSRPIFVPILQNHHVNANLKQLEELITMERICSDDIGENTVYSGFIITSQRAVNALGAALSLLKASELQSNVLDAFLSKSKVYVVGPATWSAVVALGFAEKNVVGQQCGNGAVLSEFILDDYNATTPEGSKRLPLLFLNNKNRSNVIPDVLTSAPESRRIGLEELIVYETGVIKEFRDNFRKVLASTALSKTDGGARWVGVFSPAGADVAWDVLEDSLEMAGASKGRTFWATIGPTTEGHLADKLGKRPNVVAEQPSPEGLWHGINEFMKNTH